MSRINIEWIPSWPKKRDKRVDVSIYDMLITGDQLKTADDFRARFSRNLIGMWSTDVGEAGPTDKDLVFRLNGTGYVQSVFPNGYSGKFKWRERFKRHIEVCSVEESSGWIPLTWMFLHARNPETQTPELYLSLPEDEGNFPGSTLIAELIADPFEYSGP